MKLIGAHRIGYVRRSPGAALLVFAIAAAVAPWVVLAATQTMNVSTLGGCPNGSNWSTVGCWNNGAGPVPTTGDDVVIGTNNNPSLTNYDLAASVQLRSLTLNGANNSINITGGPIVLQSGGFITNNWDAGGPFGTLPGVTLNGAATFTHATGFADRFLGFSGAITGTGPLTLTNNGTNDNLRITVASNYTGSTTVNGTARVRFDVNGAVPTGSTLTVNGSALFQAASTIGSLAGGGNVFMNGSNTLTAGGDNTSTTFSGVYQNSGGAAALTKTGSGTLTLSGANTYTGAATVNAGTLAVNGSLVSPVTVNSGGTLGGSGTVNNTVNVNSGGTLSPGNSPGIINTGNLTLNSGSTLAIELNGTTVGTQYDQVNVTGTVDLGGATLSTSVGFTPSGGQTFTIINNDSNEAVMNTFNSLPEGSTFTAGGRTFQITYAGGTNNNDVVLTVVPPPTLGNYPDTTVSLGGNITITPDAAPTNATAINVSTSTNFKGTLSAAAATGVVRVTNASPADSYTVTITAFNSIGGTTSKTFQLTVQQGTACAGASVFTSAADAGAGNKPSAVAIGDFNNDLQQDFAVANSFSNNVSIRLGNGMGGFTTPAIPEVSVGASPFSVAIGDFNNDGKQDFASANANSNNKVSIRLGDGMGGFTSPATPEVVVGLNPVSVAIGDFNNDGKQDFAAANFGSNNKVSIRLGDGMGGFTSPATPEVVVGTNPNSVAIGDFNNDGKQDFVTANQNSNNISIRLGNGIGGFTSPAIPEVVVDANPQAVAVGDFNNDGQQDFAAANATSNNVSIRLGNGLGGFTTPATSEVGVGATPNSVAIGDFNNDGNLDFVTANETSNNVSVRLGNGMGGFASPATPEVGVGNFSVSVALGDFNNDGKQDFASANHNSNNVSIRLGGCNLTPTITAAAGLSRQQGSPVTNSQIATVTDDGGNGSVVVTVTSLNPSNGVAISNIVNTSGAITADIVANCTAANASFTLQASDGASTSTATLNVTVNANTAPTLSYTNPAAVAFNGSTTVTPATAADNGSITGYNVQSVVPALMTTPTVNSSGVVSITNAQPAGTHTITIRATDNCGVTTDASFVLTVNKANQSITVNTHAPANATYNSNFTVAATSDSGLPVSYSSAGACTNAGATFTMTSGTGTCTVKYDQAGNGNYNPATQVTESVTAQKANTATAVSSSVNPSDFGQSVTFTATVTSGAGTPSGTVQFKDNGNNIGAAVNLNAGGGAQVSTSTLTVGTHTVTADYSGDTNFNVSTGTLSGGQVVKAQPTLSINDVSVSEGNAGTKVLNLTVTLSAASSLTVTANYATTDGTATAPSDYAAIASTLLTFNPGETSQQVSVTINGDIGFEADETLFVNLSNPVNATIGDNQGLGTIQNDDAQGGFISFSNVSYSVNEITGIVTVTVVRSNDVSQAANVDYATDDTGSSTNCAALLTGLASQRCDYTSMFGTLKFAANETQKTIDIPINLDAYTEGPETFTIKLSNLTGGAVLAVPSTAIVTINDSASPAPNANDDTTTFVRQQYRDFLNREADPSGLAFWVNNIGKCNDPAQRAPGQTPAACIEVQRITTSAAFFLSIEFRQTGGLVRDFYVAALDRPATNNMPNFVEFMRDTQAIQKGVTVGQAGWQQLLDANRTAFMNDFVTRAEFVGLYPTTDTPAQYVDKLYLHANVTPTIQERLDAISEFGGAAMAADTVARGRALLLITRHPAFQARELNRAFVQMQYFGYLRRNPNDAPDGNYNGFNFWLNKLNQFNGDFLQAEMVKAFLTSIEYRSRFGP